LSSQETKRDTIAYCLVILESSYEELSTEESVVTHCLAIGFFEKAAHIKLPIEIFHV